MSAALSQSADARTPLQRALSGAPLAESLTADLKKGTWTFKVPSPMVVAAGRYVLLPEVFARSAIEQERRQVEHTLTLGAPGTMRMSVFTCSGNPALEISDCEGYELTLYRDYASEAEHSRTFNPAHWYGSESRRDSQGRKWNRHGLRFVTDCFGELVEVAA